MVRKIKLHAIGNDGNFNYYILDKKQEAAKVLFNLFFDVLNIDWSLYERNNKPTSNKGINIEKFKDHNINLFSSGKKNNVRANIFFGDKKMFLVILCSQKLRLKFNEELGKVSIMPEYKHKKDVKKIKSKKSK